MTNTTDQERLTAHEALDETRSAEARRYVQQRQAFRVHAGVFACSMIGIVLVNLLVNLAAGIAGEWSAWWSLWALLGWGIGVTVHGLAVRLAHARLVGASNEERQVDAVLASSLTRG